MPGERGWRPDPGCSGEVEMRGWGSQGLWRQDLQGPVRREGGVRAPPAFLA